MQDRLECVRPEADEPPNPQVSVQMFCTDRKTMTNCCFIYLFFSQLNNLVSVFSSAGPSICSWLSFALGRRHLQAFQCGFLKTCALPAGKGQEAPLRKRHLQPVAVTAGSVKRFARIQPHNRMFPALNSLLGFHSFNLYLSENTPCLT